MFIGGIEWSRRPRQWRRHWLSLSLGGGSRHLLLPHPWSTSSVPSSKDNERLSKENKNLAHKLKHQVERNETTVLKGQIEDLKVDIVEKESRLDHI